MAALRLSRLAVVCLAGALLGGCAAVQPWERGVLAKPHMALDQQPLATALQQHVQNSRQAAPAGGSGEGGGCGCY